ncbi:hypothetical protein J2Z48_000416 [Croceifilum oryzae]|uniref:Uncharacterized protein n=1 Tax=Croceifilum oryzae TaxID=1553429 RepID=A0AAJ1TGS1_9BACL|nr:hypothetical protein [Croceifilum oryzae]MDQ0416252.1 hypothetical protein [Croceifilum oryzae]
MGSIAIIIAVFAGLFKLFDYILRANNKKPVFTPAINRLEDFMDFIDDDDDEDSPKKKKRHEASSKPIEIQEMKPMHSEPVFPRASEQFRPNPSRLSQGVQQAKITVKPKRIFSPSEVQKAFVHREILGAPRALNPYRSRRYPR